MSSGLLAVFRHHQVPNVIQREHEKRFQVRAPRGHPGQPRRHRIVNADRSASQPAPLEHPIPEHPQLIGAPVIRPVHGGRNKAPLVRHARRQPRVVLGGDLLVEALVLLLARCAQLGRFPGVPVTVLRSEAGLHLAEAHLRQLARGHPLRLHSSFPSSMPDRTDRMTSRTNARAPKLSLSGDLGFISTTSAFL